MKPLARAFARIHLFRLIILVCFFSLAGCGGGGGGGTAATSTGTNPGTGGGGDSSDNTVAPTPSTGANPGTDGGATTTNTSLPAQFTAAQRQAVSSRILRTPSINKNAEGITQPSDSGARVTADATYTSGNLQSGSIDVTVTGQTTTSPVIPPHWGTVSSTNTVLRSLVLVNSVSGATYQEEAVFKQIGSGGVAANVFTNRMDNSDTDYLVAGYWLYVPDGANPTPEAGAFANAVGIALTPGSYIAATSTADYKGDAAGIWSEKVGNTYNAGEFTGDVSLTANFGLHAGIEGSITNIEETDDNRDPITLTNNVDTITLTSAVLSNAVDQSVPGGSFSALTRATVGSNIFTGRWGGQFHGDNADNVIGTFDFGIGDSNPSDHTAYVGAFVAEKE